MMVMYNRREMYKAFSSPLIRQIWVNAGIILATIIVGIVAMSFVLGEANARADALVSARAAIAMQSDSLNLVAQLQKDASTAANYQKAIRQLLPTQDDLISFPQKVATLGKSYSVGVSIAFRGDPVPSNGNAPGNISFSMTLDGNQQDVSTFLKYLEFQSTQFLIAIDSANVSFNNGNEHMTANARVFFQ